MAKLKVRDDYYDEILIEFLPLFKDAIELEIQLGNNITIEDAKNQGKKTSDSGLLFTKKDVDNYLDKLELNIKDANRDLSKQISNAVMNNIAERGDGRDLANTIKDIFTKDTAEHFNYKNRYKTIARTESTGVLSTSGFNKAKKLGAAKKYLTGVSDSRQGEDSKIAVRKYGTPEQAIPIDENFVFTDGKKTYDYLLPPNRPNDRELVLYIFE